MEDYASELCISAKYLTTVCKRISGKTAKEWICEHMLEEIRYHLKQTDLPMKQISDRLGFATPSFFGKYVKAYFGMTPMQFRKNSPAHKHRPNNIPSRTKHPFTGRKSALRS